MVEEPNDTEEGHEEESNDDTLCSNDESISTPECYGKEYKQVAKYYSKSKNT